MAMGVSARHPIVKPYRERVGQCDVSKKLRLNDVGHTTHNVAGNYFFNHALVGVAQSSVKTLYLVLVVCRTCVVKLGEWRDSQPSVADPSGHAS